MKTSLTETADIESFLFKTQEGGESVLFQASLILDKSLPGKVALQKRAYDAVQNYSRKKLREEIAAVELELFSAEKHNSFRKKISRLFSGR